MSTRDFEEEDTTADIFESVHRVLGVEPEAPDPNDDGPGDTLGAAAVAALRKFQKDIGLRVSGELDEATRAAILRFDAVDDDGSTSEDQIFSFGTATSVGDGPPLEALRAWCEANGTELIDYRDTKKWPRNKTYSSDYGYPYNKVRADPPKGGLRRDWDSITTFMLHTTAVSGMTAKRGLGIPCHLYLPKENAIVLCHELELLLYHGHSGNGFSVGLEIAGDSDWDCPSQVERARALLRYFQEVRRANLPGAACAVMAHRMAHDSRVKDPGKRIWQDAGEWAITELGYKLGPVVGSGMDVDAWRDRSA